jgi:hypothetical protein
MDRNDDNVFWRVYFRDVYYGLNPTTGDLLLAACVSDMGTYLSPQTLNGTVSLYVPVRPNRIEPRNRVDNVVYFSPC